MQSHEPVIVNALGSFVYESFVLRHIATLALTVLLLLYILYIAAQDVGQTAPTTN